MAPTISSLFTNLVLGYAGPPQTEAEEGAASSQAPAPTEPVESVDISPVKDIYFSYLNAELSFLEDPNSLGTQQSLFHFGKGEGRALNAFFEGSDLTLIPEPNDEKTELNFRIGIDCKIEATPEGNKLAGCSGGIKSISTWIKHIDELKAADLDHDGKMTLAEAEALIESNPSLKASGVTAEQFLTNLKKLMVERYGLIGRQFKDHMITIPWYPSFDILKLYSAGAYFSDLQNAHASLHPNNPIKSPFNFANAVAVLLPKAALNAGGLFSDTVGQWGDSIPWAFVDDIQKKEALERKQQRDYALTDLTFAIDDAIVGYIKGDEDFAWVALMEPENLMGKSEEEQAALRKQAMEGALEYLASDKFAQRSLLEDPEAPTARYAESAKVLVEQIPIFELHGIVTQSDPYEVAKDLLDYAEAEFSTLGLGGGHMPKQKWPNWSRVLGQLNNLTFAEGIINSIIAQKWSDQPGQQAELTDRAMTLREQLKGNKGEWFNWSEAEKLNLPGYAAMYLISARALYRAPDILNDLRKYHHSLNGHAMTHLYSNYLRQGLLYNTRWTSLRGRGVGGFAQGLLGNTFGNASQMLANVAKMRLGRGIGSSEITEAIAKYNAAPGAWTGLQNLRNIPRLLGEIPRLPVSIPMYLGKGAISLVKGVGKAINQGTNAVEGAASVKKGVQKLGQVAQATQHKFLGVMLALVGPGSIHSFLTLNEMHLPELSQEGIREFLLPAKVGEKASLATQREVAVIGSMNAYDVQGDIITTDEDGIQIGAKKNDFRRVPDPRALDAAYSKAVEQDDKTKSAD